ncbi:phage tail tape measure protein, partial [Enterobacter hormaechei]|nr:phage tail tape measure protein [Enterobacter hormaechei]
MSEKAGEIYYDIEADVSGLLKAQGKANKSLDSIGNSATNAAKKMDELQTNINRVAGAIAASLVVDWGKAFLVAADNMSQL